MMDSRLAYTKMPKWQQGFTQALQGIELHTIPPTSSDAHQNFEFEFPRNATLLFGPMSGFLIKGNFESKENADADDSTFTQLDEESGSEVALIPNWFEHLIDDIKVYHGNNLIQAHDVPRNADPFLNTYIYANMNSDIKDKLFPEPYNPGRCVGIGRSDWSFTNESNAWRKYSKELFKHREITFRYTPTFLFPFYQQSSFGLDGRQPNAVPMQAIGKMAVSLMLKEKRDGIFLRKENNEKIYRFNIQSIHLVVEEARLNLAFEKKLLNRKDPFIYEGTSRIGIYENISAGSLNYRCRLPNVLYPEGIFVCALPKESLGYNFQWTTATTEKIFMPHNIESMKIRFENKPLALRSPNLGDFESHMMGIKQFLDYKENPPFGVLQEQGRSNFDEMKDAGKSTVYPHVYINLTPSGKESRIVPIGDDGHVVSRPGDVDITLNFGLGGATNGAVYLIYIFYTDVNIVFDMKAKQFKTVYKMAGQMSQ